MNEDSTEDVMKKTKETLERLRFENWQRYYGIAILINVDDSSKRKFKLESVDLQVPDKEENKDKKQYKDQALVELWKKIREKYGQKEGYRLATLKYVYSEKDEADKALKNYKRDI
jgi:hypothetical protein